VFVPDFENSSASSPAGALVEGILVFASARMKAAPAAYAYGQKIMRQKAYIAEHKAELKHMGLNEQARRIVAAVGGSDSLAKKAIREEKAQGGQLSRHK
jgi:muramoyltetrapeptide carboxypeptidase LdcA involved in peptidoglycan recycling